MAWFLWVKIAMWKQLLCCAKCHTLILSEFDLHVQLTHMADLEEEVHQGEHTVSPELYFTKCLEIE